MTAITRNEDDNDNDRNKLAMVSMMMVTWKMSIANKCQATLLLHPRGTNFDDQLLEPIKRELLMVH